MKNASCLKTTKNESPKTPGGISKSLLTPCRRVGLSRNWKKAGPSPFVSPLSGGNTRQEEARVEKKETRKRKTREETEEAIQFTTEALGTRNSVLTDGGDDEIVQSRDTEDLSSTPTRHIEVPRKKKSKTLISALSNNIDSQKIEPSDVKEPTKTISAEIKSKETLDVQETTPSVSVLAQKSKSSKAKKIISPKTIEVSKHISQDKICDEIELKENINDSKDHENVKVLKGTENVKPTSPKELTKECIVVIQKKIFKTDKKDSKKEEKDGLNKISQDFLDSDSDDVPLGQLNKQKMENRKVCTEKNFDPEPEIINLDDDDDFADNKKVKVKKVDRATSIGGLKKKPVKNSKLKTHKPVVIPATNQSIDLDDDDDFDLDNKKTILIRKTYEKVIKPQRAKSTGSITQKDIDELKAKIEVKKNLLLAKAMTEDTEELRCLIKKWQKGCQDALIELMELMRNKFPDKRDMDYSEMLSMLRIPANLVGYDDENDSFNTPEDSNIVLSKFNDL
ncbi:muscle M-line assembly protein unc-89-like [Pectinophora gossypiella]|uniref:muscle M-line assembly protein unc-89-like n=1 Tax=Pectinophora gossypiella TaxID=13191 RepID=UPI00214EC3C0|nr:muscle M-line assembly protein unc-89-like [Pectinophora gossypiella]